MSVPLGCGATVEMRREPRSATPPNGAGGTFVRAELRLHDLLTGRPRAARTHDVLIHTADHTSNGTPVPLRISPNATGHQRLMFAGPRTYVVRPTHRADGEVAIDIITVTPRRVARRLWAILLGRRRRATSTTPGVHHGQIVEHDTAGHAESALQTARRQSA
jgi:hypothetical protein